MDTIAQSLFNLLFNIINTFISSIFAPLDLILDQVFIGIDLGEFSTNFYVVLNQYIIPGCTWFANLVPPNTWALIILYFTFMVAFYSVALLMHYIIKPLTIIKKLVPFS